MAPLGEVVTCLSGGTPSKRNPEYYGGDIPWITGADIDGLGRILPRTWISEHAIKESAAQIAPLGSVLLVTRTSVGKSAIVNTPISFSQDITALLPDPTLDPAYLHEFLRASTSYFARRARGATIQGVTRATVTSLQIPLPPLLEQRRIASILDQADALRAKRRQVLAHLDSVPESLFHETFTQQGRSRQTLGDLGDWASGGTPSRNVPEYYDGEIPWYTSGELGTLYAPKAREQITRSALVESSAKLVPAGAIMLGMYDTAALNSSIATVDCACNQAVAFMDPAQQGHSGIFIYFAVQAARHVVMSLRRGVRQKNLNLSMIRSIEIPVASAEEEHRFECKVRQLMGVRVLAYGAFDEARLLSSSLLSQAFSRSGDHRVVGVGECASH